MGVFGVNLVEHAFYGCWNYIQFIQINVNCKLACGFIFVSCVSEFVFCG
jgi:hypothetical protein